MLGTRPTEHRYLAVSGGLVAADGGGCGALHSTAAGGVVQADGRGGVSDLDMTSWRGWATFHPATVITPVGVRRESAGCSGERCRRVEGTVGVDVTPGSAGSSG